MPRLQLRQRDAAHRTAILLREQLDALRVRTPDLDEAIRRLERRLNRIHQTNAILRPDRETIHRDRDRVIRAPIQLRRIRDLDELTVDVRTNESLLPHRLEQVAELALSLLHQRRTHFD